QEPATGRCRPLDRQIHLPQRRAALGGPARRCRRQPVRGGGRAQLRRRLRQDPEGLAPQFRSRLAALRRPAGGALPPHVALLPTVLRRGLPRPGAPAVAVGAGQKRRPRGLSPPGLTRSCVPGRNWLVSPGTASPQGGKSPPSPTDHHPDTLCNGFNPAASTFCWGASPCSLCCLRCCGGFSSSPFPTSTRPAMNPRGISGRPC